MNTWPKTIYGFAASFLFLSFVLLVKSPSGNPSPPPARQKPAPVGTAPKPAPPTAEQRARLLEKMRSQGVIRIAAIVAYGSKCAIVGENSVHNTDLWLADCDTARPERPERLTDNGGVKHPVWSPSGQELAYVSGHNVGIINMTTKQPGYLSGLDGGNYTDFSAPQWSPNGQAIAARASSGKVRWIQAATAQGRLIYESYRIKVSRHRLPPQFHWGPNNELVVDGRGKFIFPWERLLQDPANEQPADQQPSAVPTPQTVDPQTGRLLNLVSAAGVKNIGGYVLSPSKKMIVFIGEFEAQWTFIGPQVARPQTDLWIVNQDGSGLRRLTKDGVSYDPAWSPSEDKIAFVNEGSVKILNLKTGKIRSLPGLRAYRPLPKKRHGECDYHELNGPVWSPNGKAIAALAGNGCADGTTMVAETRFGNKIFEYDTDRFSWNSESELILERYGKQVFDWKSSFFRRRQQR